QRRRKSTSAKKRPGVSAAGGGTSITGGTQVAGASGGGTTGAGGPGFCARAGPGHITHTPRRPTRARMTPALPPKRGEVGRCYRPCRGGDINKDGAGEGPSTARYEGGRENIRLRPTSRRPAKGSRRRPA